MAGIESPSSDQGRRGAATRRRGRRADLLGLLVVVASGIAAFVPALTRGLQLGPYDMLLRFGLTADPGAPTHNLQRGDLISEMIPWTTMAWRQVHAGHLPLFSSMNGLGHPLAFNWQSAVASLPALIGYLVPVALAYSVAVIVVALCGGAGGYVAARVLGLRVPAATLAGVCWMLSGPFFVLVGWPAASVMSWAGWLLALVVLILRGWRPLLSTALLSVAWAFTLLAGQPDVLSAVAASAAIAALVLLATMLRRRGLAGLPWRRFGLLALGGALGTGLAAPIVLPSLQLTRHAIRSVNTPDLALPAHNLLNLIFVGFDGLPYASSQWFGQMFIGSAAWAGSIVVVLAVIGLLRRWRRPSVLALGVVVAFDLLLVFAPFAVHAMNSLPVVGTTMWRWSLMPMAFALALLAGHGADELQDGWRRVELRRLLEGLTAAMALLLVGLWIFARGSLLPEQAAVRDASFAWPAVGVVALLLACVVAERSAARHEASERAGLLLLGGLGVVQVALLLSACTPLWLSETSQLPRPPAVSQLLAAVGHARVAAGVKSCFVPPTVGIQVEANALYGLRELDAYDPMTQKSLFDAWVMASGGTSPGAYVPPSIFCPAVDTAPLARRFGAEFVLVPHGQAGPYGTSFVRQVGREDLYAVPASGLATVVPEAAGRRPPADALGRKAPARFSTPSRLRISAAASQASVLRIHLQRLPGWHATIDGRPLELRAFSMAMLEADLPPGRHVVVLEYWPAAFDLGLVVGGLSLLGLLALCAAGARRARRSPDQA